MWVGYVDWCLYVLLGLVSADGLVGLGARLLDVMVSGINESDDASPLARLWFEYQGRKRKEIDFSCV